MKTLAFAIVLALAAPLALAQTDAYRYVVANGAPQAGTFLACGLSSTTPHVDQDAPSATITINGDPVVIGGQHIFLQEQRTPNVGGGCTVPVTSGETVTVGAIDDLSGEVPFQVFFSGTTGTVAPGTCAPAVRGNETRAVSVPAPCIAIHVIPDAGSLAGNVYVTR